MSPGCASYNCCCVRVRSSAGGMYLAVWLTLPLVPVHYLSVYICYIQVMVRIGATLLLGTGCLFTPGTLISTD